MGYTKNKKDNILGYQIDNNQNYLLDFFLDFKDRLLS